MGTISDGTSSDRYAPVVRLRRPGGPILGLVIEVARPAAVRSPSTASDAFPQDALLPAYWHAGIDQMRGDHALVPSGSCAMVLFQKRVTVETIAAQPARSTVLK